MVRALLSGIAVRAEPRLDAERFGTLPKDSRSFVVSGPVEADGYRWVLLSGPGLPPASGCATFPGPEFSCPVWFGWAATGDPQTGEAWFADDPTDCPDPAADVAGFMNLGDVEALHCFGGRELVFKGWLSGLHEPIDCPAREVPSRWLFCPEGYSAMVSVAPGDASAVELFEDPASPLELPPAEEWVTVSGHVDDPAAEGCDAAVPPGYPIPGLGAILGCRSHFVVTNLTPSS